MDGSLLKAFEIGNQRFGVFKIYEDNRHCFLNQTNRFATTGTDFFICQFDEQLQTNSYKSKGLRPNESVTLGRDHLQDRFNYKEDDALSRTHVKIELLDGKPVITDLGSTNGTKELTKPEVLAPMPVIIKTEDVNENPEPAPLQVVSENVKEVIADNQVAEIIGQNNELTLAQSIRKFRSKHGSEIAAGSDKGENYKNRNEDRVLVIPDIEFFAVADGMGGYGDGDKAAQILTEELLKNPTDIQTAINSASYRIEKEAVSQATAAFVSARIVRTENGINLEYHYSGDCELLILDKNGNIKTIGKQDSLVQILVDQGAITEDEGLYHPRRNVAAGGIAAGQKYRKYKSEEVLNLSPGDRIILMSDGIADNFTHSEITSLIRNQNSENAIKTLEKATSERMKNANDIIYRTEVPYNPNFDFYDNETSTGRKTNGKYIDGYKSKPKPDNRGLIIIDV